MSKRYVPRSLRDKDKADKGGASGKAGARTARRAPERPVPKPRPVNGEAAGAEADERPKPSPRKPAPRPARGSGQNGRTRPVPATVSLAKRRARRVSGQRHLARYLSAVAVLLLLVGAATWYFQQREASIAASVEDARVEGVAAVQAVFSYDYRSFDSSKANGLSHLAGDRATEYDQQMETLRARVTEEKAVVNTVASGGGQLPSTGIVEVTRDGVFSWQPKRVKVLVFADQVRRNDNITGEKVDKNRIVVTLERFGGQWKAVKFDSL